MHGVFLLHGKFVAFFVWHPAVTKTIRHIKFKGNIPLIRIRQQKNYFLEHHMLKCVYTVLKRSWLIKYFQAAFKRNAFILSFFVVNNNYSFITRITWTYINKKCMWNFRSVQFYVNVNEWNISGVKRMESYSHIYTNYCS